jgi:hypothetical protein
MWGRAGLVAMLVAIVAGTPLAGMAGSAGRKIGTAAAARPSSSMRSMASPCRRPGSAPWSGTAYYTV